MAKARSARKSRPSSGAKRATDKANRRARSGASGGDQLSWHPSKHSLWSQRWGDPDNSNQTFPTTVSIRHPTVPFLGTASARNLEHDLQKIAHCYLEAANNSRSVNPSLKLPPSGWMRLFPAVRTRGLDDCRSVGRPQKESSTLWFRLRRNEQIRPMTLPT
jgi:hypothetical protein